MRTISNPIGKKSWINTRITPRRKRIKDIKRNSTTEDLLKHKMGDMTDFLCRSLLVRSLLSIIKTMLNCVTDNI